MNVVIQANSGFVKPQGSYADHLSDRKAEYKRVMSIGFPSGDARDDYWREHLRAKEVDAPSS